MGNSSPAVEAADSRSFLFTLESIGDTSIPRGDEEIDTDKLPSLRDGNWEVRMLADDPLGPAVEFTFVLSEAHLKAVGTEGSLELVKRYRLAKTPAADLANSAFPSYHLQLELEIRNRGATPQQVAYRLDGPSGLPLEGWWYVTKIHPKMFAAAGTRDVVWNTPTTGHGLIGATKIYSDAVEAQEKNQPVTIPLFADPSPQPLDYVGVDAQYFSVVLKPQAGEADSPLLFKQALAVPVGDVGAIDKALGKTIDVSFRLISQTHDIPPGGALVQRYTIFAGPKEPALLTAYQLERVIEYGWFRTIAKALSWILHVFESLPLVNYGLAIILLTVLVRSCMIPLSRKAARNAQMMQELAPEMKRIAEKYKDDMQKRAAAQSELFKKNNYRPLGGCLLMFVQLPIFIGLYRAPVGGRRVASGPVDFRPELVFESGRAGHVMVLETVPARDAGRRERLAGALFQRAAHRDHRAVPVAAKDVHAAGHRRTDADAAVDDEVHDDLHGLHVLPRAQRLVHLLHRLEPVEHRRAETAAAGGQAQRKHHAALATRGSQVQPGT